MDVLRNEILDAMSTLSEEKLKDLFQSVGLNDEDLRSYKEKNLMETLTPEQWRILLDVCVMESNSKYEPSGQASGSGRLEMRHGGNCRDATKTRRHGSYETDTSSSSSSSSSSSQNMSDDSTTELELPYNPGCHSSANRHPASLSGEYSQPTTYTSQGSVDSCGGSESGEYQLAEDHNYLNLENWSFQNKSGSELQYMLVEKLVLTEREYVARLNTIYRFYCLLLVEHTNSPFLEEDTLRLIFSNVKSIYLLHKDSLLPQLEETLSKWKSDPKLGETMKRNAPFLKIYGEYIANFTKSIKHIDEWMNKSSRFHDIILRVEQPQCENLSLQHLMMEPVKRLMRYKALMTDYIRSTPPNSWEFQDAHDALHHISKATNLANESLSKIEVFKELLDIYNKLRGVPQDFITPTRHYVTDGPVTEISSKTGEVLIRHLFLFNDFVLVCTKNELTDIYNVWKMLDMKNLTMKPCENVHFPNAFELQNDRGTCILLDQNLSGVPLEWEKKIEATLNMYHKKLKERETSFQEIGTIIDAINVSHERNTIGLAPPVLVSDPNVTKCMMCDEAFGLARRRHNCMACGKLICKACSKMAKLEYKQGREDIVCSLCFDILTPTTAAYKPVTLDIGSSTFYSDA